jgi:outer membrane lipoprotein-sorting protein
MLYPKSGVFSRLLLLLSLLLTFHIVGSAHSTREAAEKSFSRSLAVARLNNRSNSSVKLWQRKSLSPRVILQRMLFQYRTIKSYEAVGLTTCTYLDAAGRSSSDVPFTLYFQRPRAMRLEWTDPDVRRTKRRGVLWSNGKQVNLDVIPKELSKVKTLEDALDTASVLSAVAPYMVAKFLIGEKATKEKINDLENLKLLDSTQVDGEDCYVIAGVLSGDGASYTYKFWIGKEDYLIRKLEQILEARFKNGTEVFMTEETHTKVKVNHQIPANLFDYNFPPGSGGPVAHVFR